MILITTYTLKGNFGQLRSLIKVHLSHIKNSKIVIETKTVIEFFHIQWILTSYATQTSSEPNLMTTIYKRLTFFVGLCGRFLRIRCIKVKTTTFGTIFLVIFCFIYKNCKLTNSKILVNKHT